jgi:hypothetical protein
MKAWIPILVQLDINSNLILLINLLSINNNKWFQENTEYNLIQDSTQVEKEEIK